METLTKTATARTIEAPAIAPACDCGATLAPNGACLEVGECEKADNAATRGAGGARSKYTVAPAAWNASGRTD